MTQTAIIIGTPATCRRVEQQLRLLQAPPRVIGHIHAACHDPDPAAARPETLGDLEALESITAAHRPDLALLSLPSMMSDLVTSIRTRLRRIGLPDRFLPTLEDLLDGIGPRTQLEIDLAALLDRPPRSVDEEAVAEVITDRRVLITGAGGSIGSELARQAVRFEPRQLVLVDRAENALFEIDRQIARLAPRLERRALLHDVVEVEETRRQFRALRPQVVFHAAAHKHVPMMENHPAAAVDNNLFGTKSAADAAHDAEVDRFVMISTDKAVNPASIMGATKRFAELYIQHRNENSATAYSMVRFGNVLGSAGSVLETWSRQLRDGGPITVTDRRMTRYFMTIPEAAALVMQAAGLVEPAAPGGEIFVLDMDQPVRIVDLARRFVDAHGLQARLPDEPASPFGQTVDLVFTSVRPGEKLHEELACSAEHLLPTRHPDINIWTLPTPDRRYIRDMIQRLAPGRRPDDSRRLAGLIRSLVPRAAAPAAA